MTKDEKIENLTARFKATLKLVSLPDKDVTPDVDDLYRNELDVLGYETVAEAKEKLFS